MVEGSLVSALQTLFHKLMEEKGVLIDRAAMVPAYDGMVSGLFILTVSMPDGKSCEDKTRCLIHGLHSYVSQEERKSVAGVRVFDSALEFDQYMRLGYNAGTCEVCEEELRMYSPSLRPEMIPVEA